MAWKITKDLIENGADVGVRSRGRELSPDEETIKFKMFDGDGELYYEGVMSNTGREEGFEPLDDFGTPNAGCTAIHLFEKGRWSQL